MPFFAVFFAFQIAPLIWILVNSFYSQTEEAWGLANYSDILSSPFYLQAIRFSLVISYFLVVLLVTWLANFLNWEKS